jgi:hypothetical protein
MGLDSGTTEKLAETITRLVLYASAAVFAVYLTIGKR